MAGVAGVRSIFAAAHGLRRQPATFLALAVYATVAVGAFMLVVVLHMPVYGARFVDSGDGVAATLRDGRTVALADHSAVSIVGRNDAITVPAGSLVTDYMPDGGVASLRGWYRDRDRIAAIADTPGATIKLAGDSAVLHAPLARRPARLADLSRDVWLLAIQAVAIGLLGVAVRLARPRDRRAWIFGASCDGVFIAAFAGAVFDARELTANGTLLQVMQGLNFIGSNLCSVGLAALFLHVPHDIAPRRVAPLLLVFAVVAGVLEGIGVIPRAGFYIGLLTSLALFLLAGIDQWRRSQRDPHARALLRWVGAWTFAGTAVLGLGMAAPILLGVPPLASDGMAIVPLALVYGGIGFGVAGFRVIEVDRWAYRVLLGAAATLALLVADAVLVLTLDLDQPVALVMALLGIGYLYFPLRAWAWRRSRGAVDLSSDTLFRQATTVVFAANARDRRGGWRGLLDRLFEPLEIAPADRAVAEPELADEGEALLLPQTADDAALRLRFAGRGRRAFGAGELRTARELIAMIGEAERARAEYGRGVADERQRVARDLHDDVSAHLLSGLHRRDIALVRDDVRRAMAEIRTMIASLSGGTAPLATVLADLRHETAQRLAAAGIALDWATVDEAVGDAIVDYARHKAIVSSCREVVSNVVKHAGATRCVVVVRVADARLRLTVADDGAGLRAERATGGAGRGLANIAARVTEVGGSLNAAPGAQGFRVAIELPLTA